MPEVRKELGGDLRVTPPHATTPSALAPNTHAERSSFLWLISVRAFPAYYLRLLPKSSAARRSLHLCEEGREGGKTGEEERWKAHGVSARAYGIKRGGFM